MLSIEEDKIRDENLRFLEDISVHTGKKVQDEEGIIAHLSNALTYLLPVFRVMVLID